MIVDQTPYVPAVVTVAGHQVGWLWLLIDALAVYRLARLVTTDGLLARPRDAVMTRWLPERGTQYPPDHPVQLVLCAWCCSPWIAVAVLAVTVWLPGWWVWLAVPLAFSAVAGFLSELA